MALPLYHGLPPFQYDENLFNTGLWYNKFCNTWSKDNGEPEKWELGAPEKLAWMDSIAKTIGSEKLLNNAINRQLQLTVARQGECLSFSTDSRFATGLGLEHTVEIGFLWHSNLGVPYIPGSTVKGMVRDWAMNWGGKEEKDALRIFGTGSEKEPVQVGTVIFFDALPMEKTELEIDVMTPHYGPYYQEDGETKEPPADWHSPTPIYFLTVAARQKFLFSVAPRKEKDKQDVSTVVQWLKEALSEIGIGGKTAVGYGRFNFIENISEEYRETKKRAEEEAQQQERLQANPILAEMVAEGYERPADGVFMKTINNKWLAKLDSDDTDAQDKKEIAKLLAQWYHKKSPTQWQKPNPKNRGKIGLIKSHLD